MSYAAYQRIRYAAQRDAYMRARQLGLSADEAAADAAMVGAFITAIADGLGATSGMIKIAISDTHTIELVERPSSLDPAFFASRFYLRSEDRRAPNFVAIGFVGHDRAAAVEKLKAVADNVAAARVAEEDWGAA